MEDPIVTEVPNGVGELPIGIFDTVCQRSALRPQHQLAIVEHINNIMTSWACVPVCALLYLVNAHLHSVAVREVIRSLDWESCHRWLMCWLSLIMTWISKSGLVRGCIITYFRPCFVETHGLLSIPNAVLASV